jgi:DNA-binding CsgD family transcriptional regulator
VRSEVQRRAVAPAAGAGRPTDQGSAKQLRSEHHSLQAAQSVPELFALVAAQALAATGSARPVGLCVTGASCTAADTAALDHPPSDALRRRVLAHPIPIVSGTPEAELARRPEGKAHRAPFGALAEVFDSGYLTTAVIRSGAQPLALLIGDRADRAYSERERDDLDRYAALAGIVLEHVVLRTRVAELAAELRELNMTSQAMARDVLDGPMALPSARRLSPSQARFGVTPAMSHSTLAELLTARELQVAGYLIRGMPNRQIAEALVLSPNTVKSHVARILRKLGATNRSDAVARLIRIGDPPLGGGA